MPDSRASRIGAVVLAAGEARRFGGPKLTMPFGDSTVVGCVVSAVQQAGASPVVVVTSADGKAVLAALQDYEVRAVTNPDPSRGMLSSIQAGVAALPTQLDAFVFALGDQPRVGADHVRRLIREHESSGKGIALPKHQGKRGHPLVFSAKYCEEIRALAADRTLRDVIHGHEDDIVEVDFDHDAVLADIDTREEYEQERRRT